MDSPSFSKLSSSHSTSTAAKKKGGATVKLSTDPQSVAARRRRHRISDRFKILQSLVPGGSKLDTVSMLEQAIQYVKFLKNQIWLHHAMINFVDDTSFHNSVALPFNQQEVDLCDDYYVVDRVLAEMELPEFWYSGDENWGAMHT